MSNVVINPNASGSGTITVTAPSTNSNYTITIPAETGTLVTTATTNPYLGTAQTWTAPQRGTVTTDNDLSFDMNVTNNFSCTPTAGGALTFTNITSGQSGFILLVNNSNYAITAAATTKVASTTLATISATGTYLLSYWSNGTNVYVTNSAALA
jgi:hypothetical protein